MPPLQIRNSVAMEVNHAKRCSQDRESLFMRAKSLILDRLQGAAVYKPPNEQEGGLENASP
jgi:hypothetical protein